MKFKVRSVGTGQECILLRNEIMATFTGKINDTLFNFKSVVSVVIEDNGEKFIVRRMYED